MNIKDKFRSISREVLTPNFILSHILIPLGVLSLYFAFLSLSLPEGVNKVFATRSVIYFLPTTIFLFIVYFAFVWLRRNKHQFTKSVDEVFLPRDLILLLLPLTPIVQYIIRNADILSWFEYIIIFFLFALFAAIPIFIVPLIFRNTGSSRGLMFLGVAITFLITNMAALSGQFSWYKVGSLKIQLIIFISVWIISWLLYKLNLQSFLYLLLVLNFLSNSILQFSTRDAPQGASELNQTDNLLIKLIDSREPVFKPNIYLLVYDAYVENETMLAHGIDNQLQEQYLKDQKFKLYPKTYTLKGHSIASMGSVLNNSLRFSGNRREAVSGGGIVQNLFTEFGYITYGIFPIDYFFRGFIPSYDYSFPSYGSSLNTVMKAIFLGEFRFDIDFDKVSREQFIQEKHNIFSEEPIDPKFIYTHSNFPNHSQDSGACLPNEVELFRERLTKANIEMRQDVELVIENDPEAIIIVAGDHGPYLTKNCLKAGDDYDISEISRLDIQDRFGSFLAIRWPTSDFEDYDDITILQDLFPVIFAYLLEDPGLLESKLEPIIDESDNISGASIINGMITGGIHDGEPLFP